MKCIVLILFLSLQNAFCGFVMLTTLYNEEHEDRVQEYLTCLAHNKNHPALDELHVLYDVSKDKDDGENIILHYLIEERISFTIIHGRPTFGTLFSFVNTYYENKKIIITNADIYFNDTLNLLLDVDLHNVFLALTRWNIKKNGDLEIAKNYKGKNNRMSQDTWIFMSPLLPLEHDNFFVGALGCDNQIAYQAKKAGLSVYNPSLDIQCCHLHLSGIKNSGRKKLKEKNYPITAIPLCRLAAIKWPGKK